MRALRRPKIQLVHWSCIEVRDSMIILEKRRKSRGDVVSMHALRRPSMQLVHRPCTEVDVSILDWTYCITDSFPAWNWFDTDFHDRLLPHLQLIRYPAVTWRTRNPMQSIRYRAISYSWGQLLPAVHRDPTTASSAMARPRMDERCITGEHLSFLVATPVHWIHSQ